LKCAPLSLPKELMVSVSHEFEKLYNDCVLQNTLERKKLMPQNLLAARDKRNETMRNCDSGAMTVTSLHDRTK